MDHDTPAVKMTIQEYFKDLEWAAQIALARRREAGEIMTYFADGWVLREHSGGRIERLAPIAMFRAEDFPIER